MPFSKKLLWGGLGWVMGGPIGAILGYAFASMSENQSAQWIGAAIPGDAYTQTKSADFIISILVLFAKVMKADGQLLKSELDYIKKFLLQQFGAQQTNKFMVLFKDILKQEYPLRDVCRQIQRSMDHPSRLELIHVLFGLSAADGHVHPEEVRVIQTIANYLNINDYDFKSIYAMFSKNEHGLDRYYKILEIEKEASLDEIKKSYRKLVMKYHPDKLQGVSEDIVKLANEKFLAIQEAYEKISQRKS